MALSVFIFKGKSIFIDLEKFNLVPSVSSALRVQPTLRYSLAAPIQILKLRRDWENEVGRSYLRLRENEYILPWYSCMHPQAEEMILKLASFLLILYKLTKKSMVKSTVFKRHDPQHWTTFGYFFSLRITDFFITRSNILKIRVVKITST